MAGRSLTTEDIRDYIADYKRRAELHLDQGFGSLDTAVDVQRMITRAAELAIGYHLEDELPELRQISDRIEVATYAFLLQEIPFNLDHGECPPECDWKWSDYEHTIARSRAWGLDVTEAERALARARRVAASWARGYDDPEHEEEERQERRAQRRRATTGEAEHSASVPGEPVEVQGPATDGGVVSEQRPEAVGRAPVPEPPTNEPRAEMEEAQPAGPSADDTVEGPQRAAEVELSDPPGPSAQPGPRFPLAGDASAEAIQRHFSEVEAAIPPRLTGTATAVELWQAIREAHQDGALPITGNWVDLVSALHHRGFLPHLPSDRASRAALTILAELSPLVRRLHHRRWFVGVEH